MNRHHRRIWLVDTRIEEEGWRWYGRADMALTALFEYGSPSALGYRQIGYVKSRAVSRDRLIYLEASCGDCEVEPPCWAEEDLGVCMNGEKQDGRPCRAAAIPYVRDISLDMVGGGKP